MMLKIKNKIKQIKKQINISSLLSVAIIFLMVCLIVSPMKYINSASQGIKLWVECLLPALFPFFVFSKLLMELNLLEKWTRFLSPLMQKFFGTSNSSSYIFLISILSGYPLGSKLVLDAFSSGKIGINEAHRITTFTSVSGPFFIVGTVGTSMLLSPLCGYIILVSHILGAIINGITFKNYCVSKDERLNINKIQTLSSKKDILTVSIKSSIDSILLIGGLVCIFYVGMEAMSSLINIPSILQGLIEITNGSKAISLENIDLKLKTILCCLIITFGGFCTHAQAMYFLKQCNISYSFFIKQKITHTVYSTLLCAILALIFI